MSGGALYAVERGIATITLDEPESANALSPKLVDALGDHLQRAAEDIAVRVIVLTNHGRTFCAGADLKAGGLAPARHSLPDILSAMLDHAKPIVGRIAGHCMGGGVGLAAACDISIAADDVRFGFTEVRIGVAPAIISVVCLPKLRVADALELFLTGEVVPAARASEVGLVNRVATRDDLDEAVATVVEQLTAGAPGALTASKGLVRDIPQLSRHEAFAEATRISAALFASEDAKAGMAAFRAKTAPPWVPPA
jgi:enoyl-CoA hydratase/carnithine racemase